MITDSNWTQKIQNPQIIRAIFGNSVPDFSEAKLISYSSIFYRFEIRLEFVLERSTIQMPKKCIENGADSVLVSMYFDEVTYRNIKLPVSLTDGKNVTKIRIRYENNLFNVSLFRDSSGDIFCFDSKFLSLSFSGITNSLR